MPTAARPFGAGAPAAFDCREPVGLLACGGRFPIVFAEKARECGIPVICVAAAGMADPALEAICTEFTWLRRTSIGTVARTKFSRRDACTSAGLPQTR